MPAKHILGRINKREALLEHLGRASGFHLGGRPAGLLDDLGSRAGYQIVGAVDIWV